jgi:hypothetical protein
MPPFRNDNLDKRTTRTAAGKTPQKRSGRPLAARYSTPLSRLYPRSERCVAGCIMTAATLRQTAIPDATVKSEIHMTRFPRSLLFTNAHSSGP